MLKIIDGEKFISESNEEIYRDVLEGQSVPDSLPVAYLNLIKDSNGGFTEDRYFHFFGFKGPRKHKINEWNAINLWKKYFGLTDDCFVFAEDMFGNQYFFKRYDTENVIYVLWISTGQIDFMADKFEYFVHDIVDDTSAEIMGELKGLGRSFFLNIRNKWEPFKHISHKIPVLLGGKDELDNLELCDSLTNIILLGQLNSQLKNLPFGACIKDVIYDKESLEVHLIFEERKNSSQ